MASIGRKSTAGFLWMLGQTLGSRVVNIGGQIALAWLLMPEEFGLISLAYTVATFATVLQRLGLNYVLVQRQRHFHRWVSPGFWMGMASGLAAALFILLATPLASHLYSSPGLAGLLLVLAFMPLLEGLALTPQARLQVELRFRAIAVLATVNVVLHMGLAVLLAWWGFGAYAFVLGQVGALLIRAALLWRIAPVRVRWQLQLRRWRLLLGDTSKMFGAGFFNNLLFQADYIVLGILHTDVIVGLYFFAYRLSTQTLQLLSISLGNVLFPALSKLQDDPQRQYKAFTQSTSVLAMIGIPACFLQAALADPVIRLIFEPKWYPAIPILQILSLGMAFRLLFPAANSLIRAQGRFTLYLTMSIVSAGLFLLLVTIAALLGEAVLVAIGASLAFVLLGPILLYQAIQPLGGQWLDVLRIYLPPLALSSLAAAPAVALAERVPDMTGRELAQIPVIGLVGIAIYLPAARWLMPGAWAQLIGRLTELTRPQARGHARTPQADS